MLIEGLVYATSMYIAIYNSKCTHLSRSVEASCSLSFTFTFCIWQFLISSLNWLVLVFFRISLFHTFGGEYLLYLFYLSSGNVSKWTIKLIISKLSMVRISNVNIISTFLGRDVSEILINKEAYSLSKLVFAMSKRMASHSRTKQRYGYLCVIGICLHHGIFIYMPQTLNYRTQSFVHTYNTGNVWVTQNNLG